MKLLAILFLVGLALASAVPLSYNDDIESEIDQISDELGDEFIIYAEAAPERAINLVDILTSWRDIIQRKGKFDVERIRENIREGRYFPKLNVFFELLEQEFGPLVEQMKKAFDGENGVSENMVKKAQDFNEKLKNLNLEVQQIIHEQMRQRSLKKIKQIFEKRKGKNSVEHAEGGIASQLRERLENLISRMKKNFDDGKGVRGNLMKKANDVYEKFKNLGFELREKFKNMFEDLRSKVSRTRSAEEKRSIKEIYEKVKNYFKDLNIELKERFVKFGEYVKEQYQKVLDKSKPKIENIKNIAKEFLDDGKKMSKDMAEEALEFFREYKNDLGIVWNDIHAKVRDILKKKE